MAEFAEKNRQVFDKKAGSYMNDFSSVIQSICNQVENRRLWISDKWADIEAGKGQELRMLEYACGPGAISATLAPFVTKVIGLDVSDNMVAEFNKTAKEAGYSDKMFAQRGDLLAESASFELSGPEFFNFDAVVVSMALHHFDDAGKALKSLAERLKTSGTCVIVDLVPDSHDFHQQVQHFSSETAETVKTHGFTLEQMRDLFAGAGLTNFGYHVFEEPVVFRKNGKEISKTLFLAKAQRS